LFLIDSLDRYQKIQLPFLIIGLLFFPFIRFSRSPEITPLYLIPLAIFTAIGFLKIIKKIQFTKESRYDFLHSFLRFKKTLFRFEHKENAFWSAFIFLIITLVINAIFTIKTGLFHLKFSLIYTFLFFFSYTFYKFYQRNTVTFANVFFKISLFLIFIHLGIIASNDFNIVVRNSYFYTQNQLAFWALVNLLSIYKLRVQIRTSQVLLYFVYLSLSFIIIFSFSRSGVLSMVFFWLYFLTQQKLRMLLILGIFISLSVGSVFMNYTKIASTPSTQILYKRYFKGKDVHDLANFISGRGLDKVKNNPHLMFFGAGEGFHQRFRDEFSIHNVFINVLFSYGITGLFFFLLFWIYCITDGFHSLLIIMPVILFGLFHDIAHNLYFWLFLVILLVDRSCQSRASSVQPNIAFK
jgi:hypothetical protein